MRSTLTFVLVFMLASTMQLYGQRAVEDALQLLEYAKYDNEIKKWILNDDKVYPILARYDSIYGASTAFTSQDIVRAYDSLRNPIICSRCPNIDITSVRGNSLSAFAAPEAVAANGGVDISMISDGLAKFLVKRTKEELNIAFFNHFNKVLDDHPEFNQLFPNTTAVFKVMGKEVYRYNAFIESLREAFIQDLKMLPEHLVNYLASNPPTIFKDQRWQSILPALLNGAQEALNGASPPELINLVIDEVDYNQLGIPKVEAGLKIFQQLSNALLSDDDNRTWVKPEKIKQLFSHEIGFEILMGLLYQTQESNIQYDPTGTVPTLRVMLDTTFSGKTVEIKQHFYTLARLGNALQQNIDYLNQDRQADEKPKFEVYYEAVSTLHKILKESFELKSTLTGEAATPEEKTLLHLFKTINEIVLDIQLKNYSSAIIKTTALLTELLEDTNFKYKDSFIKYGTFMAAIAKAEDSDEVAAAIEAFALPAGSSTVKKYTAFNVSFNAYVGGFFGREKLMDVNGEPSERMLALSAPIGIAASFGLNRAGSLSFYGSLIDLGALTAFRFEDDTTQDLPKITFENILAPGAYFLYGLPADIPISIGYGVQLGPNLRKVTDTTINVTESRGLRHGFVIAVDIPLINLANIPKGK